MGKHFHVYGSLFFSLLNNDGTGAYCKAGTDTGVGRCDDTIWTENPEKLADCEAVLIISHIQHYPIPAWLQCRCSMAAFCPCLPLLSLSCSWTVDYCCLQRKREVEVAGWIVGFWLQITGCVHTNLRAKQAVPGSPRSALQHGWAFNLHCSIHVFTTTHCHYWIFCRAQYFNFDTHQTLEGIFYLYIYKGNRSSSTSYCYSSTERTKPNLNPTALHAFTLSKGYLVSQYGCRTEAWI